MKNTQIIKHLRLCLLINVIHQMIRIKSNISEVLGQLVVNLCSYDKINDFPVWPLGLRCLHNLDDMLDNHSCEGSYMPFDCREVWVFGPPHSQQAVRHADRLGDLFPLQVRQEQQGGSILDGGETYGLPPGRTLTLGLNIAGDLITDER